MSKQFSGVVEVGYSDNATDAQAKTGTYTALAGEVDAEGTIEAPPTTNNTSIGVTYGGGTLTAELPMFDHADFATLDGFMDTNGSETKKFWTFTLEDGTVLNTLKDIAPQVERMVDVDAREGATPYMLRLERYSNAPILAQS